MTEDGISGNAFPHTLISSEYAPLVQQPEQRHILIWFSKWSKSVERTFLPKSWHISSAGHTRALIGPGGGA